MTPGRMISQCEFFPNKILHIEMKFLMVRRKNEFFMIEKLNKLKLIQNN